MIQKGGIGAPGQPDPYLFNDERRRPFFMFFYGDGEDIVSTWLLLPVAPLVTRNATTFMYSSSSYDHMRSADNKNLIVGDDLDHGRGQHCQSNSFRHVHLSEFHIAGGGDVQMKQMADGFDQWSSQHILYGVS
jgi:hypothetical protein